MATKTMTTQSQREHSLRISEPSVQQIIAKARAKPARSGSEIAWYLSAATAFLLWASFTPPADWGPFKWLGIVRLNLDVCAKIWPKFATLDCGPLGWVALVPLILLIRVPQRTSYMYTAIYVTGLVNTLATLQWMRLGHQTMYVAWIALAIYMAMYFPLFVALARTAVHRYRVPLTLAVPIIWVGLEFVRAHLMTGFSWYYLAHTQHRWIELIQISDLTGAYGVSFVLALASAVLAGLVPASQLETLKLIPPGAAANSVTHAPFKRMAASVAVLLLVVAATLTYGYVRRGQAEFREGPRIALVQGNFTSEVKHDVSNAGRIYTTHRDLGGASVSYQPDLIVWPESMYPEPLYEAGPDVTTEQLKAIAPPIPNLDLDEWVKMWRRPETRRSLIDLSGESDKPMIIGINAVEAGPERYQMYNSALFVDPKQGIQGRYDKLHRVPFGEFIPLRETLPFLRKFTPYGDQFGLAAGKRPVRFDDAKHGWSYAPLICFEDTVPHVVREIVQSTSRVNGEDKPVDCLVNLTNDGWFHGSRELDQHLITASFRAVECRTPLVRAVNTGISAYVNGDGVILEPEVFIDADGKGRKSMTDPKTGRWHKQLNAVMVHPVPLDNRHSLYVQWGDWFAGLCGIGVVLAFVGGLLPRRKKAAQAAT